MNDVIGNSTTVAAKMKKFKKIGDHEDDYVLFGNYALTELMLVKKNGRKSGLGENEALNILLRNKLIKYGLTLFGRFETNGLSFRGVRMLKSFPIENEPILQQLYGYDNLTIPVMLNGFEHFSVSFSYEVDTGKCELQKHVFGSIRERMPFENLSSLLDHLQAHGTKNAFEAICQE